MTPRKFPWGTKVFRKKKGGGWQEGKVVNFDVYTSCRASQVSKPIYYKKLKVEWKDTDGTTFESWVLPRSVLLEEQLESK